MVLALAIHAPWMALIPVLLLLFLFALNHLLVRFDAGAPAIRRAWTLLSVLIALGEVVIAAESLVDEVLARFDLYRLIKPFSRCTRCNGELRAVDKAAIDLLERRGGKAVPALIGNNKLDWHFQIEHAVKIGLGSA